MDITGGKVTMSIGAFMAAEEQGCASLYVATAFKDGKPDIATARIPAIAQTQP